MTKKNLIKNELSNINKKYRFECECGDEEHTISFSIEPEEDGSINSVIVTYSLSDNLSVIKRILLAAKYIFGYRSRYGMFAETILSVEDVRKISSVCARVIKNNNVISIGKIR